MALTDNLVAWYKLDSNSNDSVGTMNGTDSSVSYANAGKIGNSATYSGSATSYTDIGASFVPTTALSVAFWFYVNSATTRQGLCGRTDGVSQATSVELIQISNAGSAKIEGQLNFGSTAKVVFAAGSPTISNNIWYHAAMTWSSASGNLTLYLNGSQIAQTNGVSGTLNNPSSTIHRRFGQYGNYTGLPMNGRMDMIGYWTREITGTEVSQLYNSGTGLDYPFSGGTTPQNQPLLYTLSQGIIW